MQRDRPPVIKSISSYQEQSLATPRTQKQTLAREGRDTMLPDDATVKRFCKPSCASCAGADALAAAAQGPEQP